MENKMQLGENKIEQKALEGQFLRNCYVKAIESTNRISTVDPKDRKKVKEMEKNFEKEQKTGKHSQEKKEANQRAFIAEIIIRDLLNDCQIFGKDVSSKQTSRYDDIFNGIDLIMYLKEELEDINKNKVLKTATAGACIDVTTYSSYLKKQTIQDKFKKI